MGAEIGLFHRGLIGTSYTRTLLQNRNFLVNSSVGVGIGGYPFGGGVNQFYYGSLSAGSNFGLSDFLGEFYLCIGVDLKHVIFREGLYNEVTDDFDHIIYKGTRPMPFLGINVVEKDIYVQFRCAPLYIVEDSKIHYRYPGFGFTIGYLLW